MFDIKIKVEGLKGIKELPDEWRSGLVLGFRHAMLMVEGRAKSSFGKAGMIKARTGHYRRSISTKVRDTGRDVIGTLAGNVIYAAIHEFGGTIFPKKGKYLRFPINGSWVSVKKVVIPKRPLLAPAIAENLDEVGRIITDRIVKEMNK